MDPTTPYREAVVRLTAYFESLTPHSVAQIGDFYMADARFKDPFNAVQGIPAIRRIFQHMFTALESPRFVVTQKIVDGPQAFLVWEFRFRFKRFDTVTEQVIQGCSHLRLSPDGRVFEHRDYWDAAEELYEKLPVLGGLMRWLKNRANQ
jgi:steroid delta-isomerase